MKYKKISSQKLFWEYRGDYEFKFYRRAESLKRYGFKIL